MEPPLIRSERLERQIAFLVEAEKLKTVLRRTRLISADRLENDAEHCWHLALMAMVLAEHAAEPVNLLRVLQMLIIHDLVEIDAGDTFAYDSAAVATQREREEQAAERLFGMLPVDQADEFRLLWEEFEARETPEAKFAAALDRLGGMIPNYRNGGGTWREMGITTEQVLRRNRPIRDGSPRLWQVAEAMIADSIQQGWLTPAEEPAGQEGEPGPCAD